ncbi:lysozyme [Brevundimonas sp. SORGH_AS_0993]|uniref:lysozyme n=1 Tax=Brevundimonas sp. SORGH_AS_0993 TaxID=3041794 RepID=UPI002789A123|nr:lysozyme [Brevundimonas sp. SORGH_AS_0993]MDQ1153119.1 lysozyme [Brevundimonas sp. SORGH_AS_0993]
MSDDVHKPAKVSREGVVLIKSFEGFRPRAVRREDGVWVIGYGHTLSAREGATVSEAEAELLLQYDLIPVVKAVSEAARVSLNPHQFDALVSFAYSIGIEPFRASEVVAHLNAGDPARAVAAMAEWDDAGAARKPTRRRSAEHALFNAAPGVAVTLADLLAAPLPSPFVEAAPETSTDDTAVSALLDQDVAPFPEATDAATATVDAAEVPLTAANGAEPAPEAEAAADPEQAQLPAAPLPARRKAPVRRAKGSWVDLATILVLGALGMLAVGAAMAAFVRASVAPGGDSTLIGWVLIVLAAACIGVSGYNLYQRWGRPDRP